MLFVLVVAIATGTVNIAVVLAALFLHGVAETYVDTTGSTLPPMLVDREDLGIANARLNAGYITLNQLVGPPIGAGLALGVVCSRPSWCSWSSAAC
ncbi:MAG: hypothetical protein U0R78_09810 [Nocardioidaceae bacterium]